MAEYKYHFRYGLTETWIETLLYIIGASSELEYSDLESHTNANSVYISWAGADDTSADGTDVNPYRTLQYAKDMMDSNQYIITILDSNYYYTGDAIDLYFDLDGIVLQGAEGQKPILRINTSIANQISMLRLQNNGKIINIDIQVDTTYSEQVTAIDAREGTIKNVTIDSANKYGIQKSTSNTVSITNTIVKNSINDGETDGSGIYFSEGTLSLDHCLLYGNDYCGIHIASASSKTLTIDHCTIPDNQYGIHTIGGSNLSLTVENSIIYRNNIYDMYGSDGDFYYTCIGKVQGSPSLHEASNVIRVNPLFVSSDDYRLRSKYNGYGDSLLLSPCFGISDTGGDLGVYEYSRVLSGESSVEFSISPPLNVSHSKVTVDSKLLTTNTLKSKIVLRGIINRLELKWSGEDNALTAIENGLLESMFESEGDIYLSTDEQVTYKQYIIDKTRGFSTDKAINNRTNTLRLNASLILYEV